MALTSIIFADWFMGALTSFPENLSFSGSNALGQFVTAGVTQVIMPKGTQANGPCFTFT